MTPEVFKRQLQVAFHIKFSDAEVAEVRACTIYAHAHRPHLRLPGARVMSRYPIDLIAGRWALTEHGCVWWWQAAKVLDTNRNGMIEAEEFLKAFFEMGTQSTHTET
jgi:hypothetical protein